MARGILEIAVQRMEPRQQSGVAVAAGSVCVGLRVERPPHDLPRQVHFLLDFVRLIVELRWARGEALGVAGQSRRHWLRAARPGIAGLNTP